MEASGVSPVGMAMHTGAVQRLALPPVCAKNGEVPGTHCLRMHLIFPRCGDSGLFYDSSVLSDVRVWTRYSILVRIIQWRVMKVQIAAQLLTS